jgi:hypothetical protein
MPLISLNFDVLLMIFKSLGDLDDPVSLAMTCRGLHSIFRDYKRRIEWAIMVRTESS